MNPMRKALFLASVLLAVFAVGVLSQSSRGEPAEAADKAKRRAVVEVVTISPGMSAAAVERSITKRIERRAVQAADVRAIVSRSIAGASIIDIEFENDVDPITALAAIQSVIQSDLARRSPSTQMPLVMLRPSLSSPRWEEDNGRKVAGVVTLTSTTLDEAMLRSAANIAVRIRLLAVPGLVAPVVLGGKDTALVFSLKPAEMEARHLSLRDVETALRDATRATTSLGSAVFGENQFLLRANSEKAKTGKEVEELLGLVIRSDRDAPVYLRDIADVRDASPSSLSVLRINGRRGVCLPIYFAAAGNEETRKKHIEKSLTRLPADLLRDIKLDWLSFHVPRQGGGADDDGLLTIHLRAPSNLPLASVEKRIEAVERFLKQSIPAKERLAILSELGVRADVSAAYTINAGQQDATIRVLFSPDRTRSAGEYARRLRKQFFEVPAFADLRISFAASDLPKPLALRIQGGTPEQAVKLARALRNRMQSIKGAVDVFIVERLDAPCLAIKVDSDKAAKVGLTPTDVLSEVRAALPVNNPPLVSLKATEFSLLVQHPEQPDLKLDDVANMEVKNKVPYPVKLGSLVSFQRTTEAIEIHHVNTARVFNVRIGLDTRERRQVVADIFKVIEQVSVPEGMKVELVDAK